MLLIPGIDLSGSFLEQRHLDRMYDAGIRTISQNLWTGALQCAATVPNLKLVLRDGRFIPQGYASVTKWIEDGGWHIDQAYTSIGADLWRDLVMVPVDVELLGITPGIVRSAVERTVVLGKRRSIYSSPELWRDILNDDPTFSDCFAYTAGWTRPRYTRPPTREEYILNWQNWGWGGLVPFAWQYDNDATADDTATLYRFGGGTPDDPGIACDLDVFDEDLLLGRSPTILEGGTRMWTRFNGVGPWWAGRAFGPTSGRIDLAADFPALPIAAQAIELEVFLTPEAGMGRFLLLDGDTGRYAGQFNANRPEGACRVVIGPDRKVGFEVQGGVRVALLGAVAYL